MGAERGFVNRRIFADHEIMKQQYMYFENSKQFDLVI